MDKKITVMKKIKVSGRELSEKIASLVFGSQTLTPQSGWEKRLHFDFQNESFVTSDMINENDSDQNPSPVVYRFPMWSILKKEDAGEYVADYLRAHNIPNEDRSVWDSLEAANIPNAESDIEKIMVDDYEIEDVISDVLPGAKINLEKAAEKENMKVEWV